MSPISPHKLQKHRQQQWHFLRNTPAITSLITIDRSIVYGAFSMPIDLKKAKDLTEYAELHPAKGDSLYTPWTYVVCLNPLSDQLIYDYKLTRII